MLFRLPEVVATQAQAARRNGHGDYLLAHAVARCLELREQLGVRALLVDALHEKAARFYRAYDFRDTTKSSHALFLPLGKG